MRPTVTWEDRHGRRGSILVDTVGVRVGTGGAVGPDLTDVDDIRKLYHALGDLLYLKTGVRA